MSRLVSELRPFAQVVASAEEVWRTKAYFYDNRRRPEGMCCVIQRTLAGRGFFAEDGRRSAVMPGHAMLFTHDEATSYGYPEDATEPYRLSFVSFSAAGVRPVFDAIRRDFGSVVAMTADGEAALAFDTLAGAYRRKRFRDAFQESELIYALLVAVYREQVETRRVTNPAAFGYHYLQGHFRSPINIKTVAAKCGVTREHFIRCFTQAYGESPGRLLHRLRLQAAVAIGRATGRPLQAIAEASGFASAQTLSRALKRRDRVAKPGPKRRGG